MFEEFTHTEIFFVRFFQKRKYKKHKKERAPANTADEAIKTMLAEKKLSTKINYDVLKDLNAGNDITSSKQKQDVRTSKIIEDRPSLFESDLMPVVYESGPVESKLSFRSGMKR